MGEEHQVATNPIQGTEVGILDASETLSLMGVDLDEIVDPVKKRRLMDVVEFFNNKSDKATIIRMVMSGKRGVDPVDHLWGYSELRKQHKAMKDQLKKLEDELYHYET